MFKSDVRRLTKMLSSGRAGHHSKRRTFCLTDFKNQDFMDSGVQHSPLIAPPPYFIVHGVSCMELDAVMSSQQRLTVSETLVIEYRVQYEIIFLCVRYSLKYLLVRSEFHYSCF